MADTGFRSRSREQMLIVKQTDDGLAVDAEHAVAPDGKDPAVGHAGGGGGSSTRGNALE